MSISNLMITSSWLEDEFKRGRKYSLRESVVALIANCIFESAHLVKKKEFSMRKFLVMGTHSAENFSYLFMKHFSYFLLRNCLFYTASVGLDYFKSLISDDSLPNADSLKNKILKKISNYNQIFNNKFDLFLKGVNAEVSNVIKNYRFDEPSMKEKIKCIIFEQAILFISFGIHLQFFKYERISLCEYLLQGAVRNVYNKYIGCS